MNDDSYQEVDPDLDAAAQANVERHAYREGVDREQTGDESGSRSPDASTNPVDVEQEVRRLRGY